MLRQFRDLLNNLSTDDPEEALEVIAQRVVNEGMGTAAILFLESAKPMGFLAGQAAIMATPFIGGFIEPMRLERYADLLGDRDFVERLIQRIEELEFARAGARKQKGESKPSSE